MMTDTDLAVQRLEELKELGVRLAMDDFGTGYSSLSYLSRFPVDILKMDRSFLRDGATPQTSALAAAVIALGETLQLEVVAEGIELDEQWRGLRDLGCGSGQGFLFAQPDGRRRDARVPAHRAERRAGAQRRRCTIATRASTPRAASAGSACSRRCALSDFRLLWSGMCISLLGDGVFIVAIAWQVYALSNAPTALALVGIAMTVPTIAFLLLGGVLSDRFDRRRLMLGADVARGLAIGAIAVLSLTGDARALAHAPCSSPSTARRRRSSARPSTRSCPTCSPPRCSRRPTRSTSSCGRSRCGSPGPALGGFLIDGRRRRLGVRARRGDVRRLGRRAAGDGPARAPARSPRSTGSVVGDIRVGFALHPQARVAVGRRSRAPPSPTSASWARPRCCCRSSSRTTSHGSAADLGLVFAAGGIGSVGCAAIIGQRGIPRRDITFMYLAWTLATLAIAGYGLATAVWQLMLASIAFNGLETAGTIVWATAKQRHVPPALLGRVSSLDWLISIGLLPLSFALTGPGERGARRAGRR